MRRLLCMVLTGAVMIGCLCTGTGAVDDQMSFQRNMKRRERPSHGQQET